MGEVCDDDIVALHVVGVDCRAADVACAASYDDCFHFARRRRIWVARETSEIIVCERKKIWGVEFIGVMARLSSLNIGT